MTRFMSVAGLGLVAACLPFLDTSPIQVPDGDTRDVDVNPGDTNVGFDVERDPTADVDVAPDVPTGSSDPCATGEPRCDEAGSLLLSCDGSPVVENCTFGCEDGACLATCAQRNGCSPDGTSVLECNGDVPEVDQVCPDGLACVGGGCRGATDCEPQSSRCNPAGDLALCDLTGAEEIVIPCPGATCQAVWLDRDGDGWGDSAAGVRHACQISDGVADNGFDCDDDAPTGPDTPCAGFSLVPEGEFLMGTPSGEIEPIPELERNQQLVAFDRRLLVMQTEVTQELWTEVSGTVSNPAFNADCSTCPLERVNWFEALEFANRLSAAEGLQRCFTLSECAGSFGAGCDDGDHFCSGGFACDRVEFVGLDCTGYRLPTEAEWEYFTRAGSGGPFAGSPADLGWYRDTVEESETQPVGGLAENAWGIQDAHGNVGEWVLDLAVGPHSGGMEEPTYNPLVFGTPEDISELRSRITRGGGFVSTENACRAAARATSLPQDRVFSVGFRLVRTHTSVGP